MENPPPPDYRPILFAAILLAGFGWIGLYIVVTVTLPTVLPRWVFFFMLILAISGTALPFLWLLHRRFDTSPASPGIIHRQSLEVGLTTAVLTWLQINRSLTLTLALIISIAMILLDGLISRFVNASRR